MAYYILNKGFKLRGWKGLPFALTYPNNRNTDFFDKEAYRLVYDLDGQQDIDEENLTESQKKLLKRMLDLKIVLPSDGKEHLEPEQKYRDFPGMYKKSMQ